MIVESLLSKIEEGRKGKNQGFSTGLEKLESITDGITKQTYTVIFSGSGAGKTSLALYSYVYRPLMEHLDDNKFRIVYFSAEINSDMIFAKLLSTYIYEKYNIQLSVKEILSRRKNYILSDEYYSIIKECVPILEKMESRIEIYDKAINAKIIYAFLSKDLEKYGKFESIGNHKRYIPNNLDMIYEVVIDHISLVTPQPGHSLKQEIDDTSKYLLTLRNIAGISPIVIQQANREQGNAERRRQGGFEYTLLDTKDSGGPVQDAEVVISIYNPFRDRRSDCSGYDINILQDKFRMIAVLKSRYGDSDVKIGVNYFGNINTWKELPLPNDIFNYQKYTTPDYIYNKETKVDNMFSNTSFNLKV